MFYLLHWHGNLGKWYFIPVLYKIQLCWQQLEINALPGCMCFYRFRRPQCRLVTAISPALMTNLLRQGHTCRGVFDNNTVSPRFIPQSTPDSKVRVANMGPTWVLAAPGEPHVGTMNLAIRDYPQRTCRSSHICVLNVWPSSKVCFLSCCLQNKLNLAGGLSKRFSTRPLVAKARIAFPCLSSCLWLMNWFLRTLCTYIRTNWEKWCE